MPREPIFRYPAVDHARDRAFAHRSGYLSGILAGVVLGLIIAFVALFGFLRFCRHDVTIQRDDSALRFVDEPVVELFSTRQYLSNVQQMSRSGTGEREVSDGDRVLK